MLHVFANLLWILGAAVVLAAFSYYGWLGESQASWRFVVRNGRAARLWIAAGSCLVLSGLVLSWATR